MSRGAAGAPGSPSAWPSWRTYLTPGDLVPVVLAALVSLQGLWRWPMWEDEIFTQNVATELPLAKVFEMAGRDRHPPGYFLLEWILGRVGESDIWLRLPSAIAAVAAVAIVAHVGRRHLGVGALGAWLLPLLPFFLVYGTMARAYAILLALGAGLLAAAFLPPRRAALTVAVLGTAGLYAHYAMALPLVAALGALATQAWAGTPGPIGRRLRAFLPAIGAVVAVAVAFAPWVLAVGNDQAARESRQVPDLAVLQWALWPVGGYIPNVAWPMLALALVGAGLVLLGRLGGPEAAGPEAGAPSAHPVDTGRAVRRALTPWIVAAAVLPILASTRSMTASKTYVFAPLLPLFVLLCAAGIRWLVPRVRARFPAHLSFLARPAVAAPLVLLLLPDACTVAALPAVPLELGLTSNGGRDVREDVALLEALAPDLNPRMLDDRAWTPYQRYLPAEARPIDQPWQRAWYGWRRTDGAEATAMSEGVVDRGCFFRRAFLNLVFVRDPGACMALRKSIETAAEEDGYPPFLLQMADFARERGDVAEAERLAALTVGRMGPSIEPSLFLARRQIERGDADAALASIEDALPLARRWRDDAQLAMLYDQAAVVKAQAGDSEGAAAARSASACARSEAPLWVCGRWIQRFWSVESKPQSNNGPSNNGPSNNGPSNNGPPQRR